MNSIDYKSIRNRPRFKLKYIKTGEEINLTLKKIYFHNKEVLSCIIRQDSAIIFINNTNKQYWAPQLELKWEVDEDDASILFIRGLYGPRPAIWTFFIFLYTLGFTLVGFFGLLWFVQIRIHISSDHIIWAWVGIFIIVTTYIASWLGKQKAKKELEILKNFMEKVMIELDV